MLSFWTAGLLRSVRHRVVVPVEPNRTTSVDDLDGGSGISDGKGGREGRYSIAYFCHPARETRLVAVPSPLLANGTGREAKTKAREGEKGEEGNGEVITAQEHLRRKLVGAYGWSE